jgi:hypothetical protein
MCEIHQYCYIYQVSILFYCCLIFNYETALQCLNIFLIDIWTVFSFCWLLIKSPYTFLYKCLVDIYFLFLWGNAYNTLLGIVWEGVTSWEFITVISTIVVFFTLSQKCLRVLTLASTWWLGVVWLFISAIQWAHSDTLLWFWFIFLLWIMILTTWIYSH